MQKMVYYAYAWTLVRHGRKLFAEAIEAWPSGPVVPSLWERLKVYRTGPLGDDFMDLESEEEFEELGARFPEEVRATLDGVYQTCMRMSAFDLAFQTMNEKPWVEARNDLQPTDFGGVPLSDAAIIEIFTVAS
jgi:uncharacterized phage-associated protein